MAQAWPVPRGSLCALGETGQLKAYALLPAALLPPNPLLKSFGLQNFNFNKLISRLQKLIN